MIALKTLIENNRHPDATVDKDNLNSLLRLPGGLHQGQARLALWINPDTMRLHDIHAQAQLMDDGFSYLDEDDLAYIPPCEFHIAGKEMLGVMQKKGIAKHYMPSAERHDLFFGAVQDLPINTAVRVFLHALDMSASSSDDTDGIGVIAELEAEKYDVAVFSKVVKDGGFDSNWAKRVVEEEFAPGGFWQWLSMEGQRGILALWLVHGDNAETEAIAMAERIPCRTESQRRKRIRTIKSYWKHFEIKDNIQSAPVKSIDKPLFITGEFTPESLTLAASLGQALQATAKVQQRNLAGLVHAISVILLVLEQSKNGHIQVSAQMLADSLCHRWPESTVTRKDADRILSWLTVDNDQKYPADEAPSKNKPACKFALLELVRDTFRDKYGDRIVANKYRPGPVLAETSLGEELKAKRRAYRRQFIDVAD